MVGDGGGGVGDAARVVVETVEHRMAGGLAAEDLAGLEVAETKASARVGGVGH